MEGRLDSFVGFVRRYVLFAGGTLGVLLLAVGVYVGPHTRGGTVLVAIGAGIVAAFVLALISLSRDDLLDALFRQGVLEVFPSRIGRCKEEYWRGLLERVSREYRVLGVANNGYTDTAPKRENYKHLIAAAISRGAIVEFLWLSPTAPAATLREAEEGRATRLDTYKSIQFFWDIKNELDPKVQSQLVLREHEHMPSCGITQADNQLTIAHYVPGQDNLDSPGWILTATPYPFYRRVVALLRRHDTRTQLVDVYLNTYKEVQASSKEINADRIADLEARRPEFDVGLPSQADNRRERLGGQEENV